MGLAERLKQMPEVLAYVKNHNLNFEAPYEHDGETLRYRPDYIVRVDDGHAEPLNLVVEGARWPSARRCAEKCSAFISAICAIG